MKLTNGALQFLYITLNWVECADIKTLELINKSFNCIEPIVLEYETTQSDFKVKAQWKLRALQNLKWKELEVANLSITEIENKMDNLWDEMITIDFPKEVKEYLSSVITDTLNSWYEANGQKAKIKGRRVTKMMLELLFAFK